MNKYFCYFEEPHKNIYFKVRPYEPNGEVKLSVTAYQGRDNVIEVCLTKEQVDELIMELNEYRNQF
ncbi:hypothetical protein KDN24_06770 [Bacillus sp. Bva_UNVM-123]|uniref:hypothetical protein n=1 Tax=Bacillus sp. Bva_UNVM-123 TaxID=2829798 RepID=UPI00391F9EFF